jgi:hypothetical protein
MVPLTTPELKRAASQFKNVGVKFIYTVLTRYGNGRVVFWSHNCTHAYAKGIRKNLATAKYRVRYYRQAHHHDQILASSCPQCQLEGSRIARLMSIIDGDKEE